MERPSPDQKSPPESLFAEFEEAVQKLQWAKLIKNPFKRNAEIRKMEIRKMERRTMEISEEIVARSNCRTLLVAALIPPSARALIKPPTNSETIDTNKEEPYSYQSALEAVLNPF